MLTRTAMAVIIAGAILLGTAAKSLARRTPAPTSTTAPTTRAADKSAKPVARNGTRTPSRYDDDAEEDEPVNTRTGKARAQQFEKGKPVDQARTRSQLDRLTGRVGNLEAALRNSKTNTRNSAKVQEDEEEDLAARRRKPRRPTTQPVTQPARDVQSTRNRYVEDDGRSSR